MMWWIDSAAISERDRSLCFKSLFLFLIFGDSLVLSEVIPNKAIDCGRQIKEARKASLVC